METTSRVAGEPGPAAPEEPGAERAVDGFLTASFPWYGLDEAFTGPRWLMQVGTAADGTVEHGSTGHGEVPSLKVEANPDQQRFAVAVTVASRPVRRSADGTGVLEATSVSTAAWLAGSGLLSCTWPQEMERGLRQDWLDQQTSVAWELADDLSGAGWTTLTLPVDGVPTDFHYREAEYGWVLAGAAQEGVHIGAYGRGMSAYGLGFAVVKDITVYEQ
ncbi:hypothetical protein GCM10012287_29000 [Streptomyces daqingensis]|uniref:Uncharacterized protein n=1 Tax=Streptomyces daqingensis TaxID=1472640 RepID=A0ABQ2ME56_9ACTN|nr:hypothetical protein [Streptomyces daqingensis]GGO50078.1 hypothetical protein GCM10012287_29000 [Streptomyces daqingensis]